MGLRVRILPTLKFAILAFCAAVVVMSLGGMVALARTSDEPDPQMDALAFARLVGGLEAEVEICAAPPATYEAALRDARAILPNRYRKVGLNPGDVERDIAKGKSDELAMHQADPSWPPCNVFRRMVVNLKCWILIAHGKPIASCPQPPPPDTPGWQDRLKSSPQ
jgi:hypothetical protein